MASETPLVLESIELLHFIRYVLNKHTAPSTLIVCCSEDAFLKHLYAAVGKDISPAGGVTGEQGIKLPRRTRSWAKPTLRLLASSRTVRVVFCPELAHLRAFLATYAYTRGADEVATSSSDHNPKPVALLAILNPIALHRPTSAYSAQGINRTLATAVDAAHRTHSQLILTECNFSDDPHRQDAYEADAVVDTEVPAELSTSSWDEEVSILNVTTKSFGAGDRGWMGRTVSVRKIAGRWCHFKDLSESNS